VALQMDPSVDEDNDEHGGQEGDRVAIEEGLVPPISPR
jgi:hypothetical protein